MLPDGIYYSQMEERGNTMAQISLRIEDDVKKKAEQTCADIGMSLSTAINIYLKKLGREKRNHLKSP